MTEANNNANPGNRQFSSMPIENQIDSHRDRQSDDATVIANNNDLSRENTTETEQNQSLNQTMNWQKVAHKLREYNRKLLKKVFKLEQELADVDNKFKKYVEKSRSSDMLVAQQESEIRKYQERVEVFSQQLATSQKIIVEKETAIDNLAQQHKLSQQQTARLERDCTLLKEEYNHQSYELVNKEKQIQQLQTKADKQQRLALQYKAELQKIESRSHREQTSVAVTIPTKKQTKDRQKYNKKTIEPWSTPANSDLKISLPKTKYIPIAAQATQSSETVKTAAKIATWTASQSPKNQQSRTKAKEQINDLPNSSVKVKPKSLAAIDLPTFPRPK